MGVKKQHVCAQHTAVNYRYRTKKKNLAIYCICTVHKSYARVLRIYSRFPTPRVPSKIYITVHGSRQL